MKWKDIQVNILVKAYLRKVFHAGFYVKVTVFYLVILSGNSLWAQDQSSYSEYLYNHLYNQNPAAAGFDGSIISQLSVSKKWMGTRDSPSAQVLSTSVRLGEEEFYDEKMLIRKSFVNLAPRVGLGLTVMNREAGPLRQTGLLLAYAYHISIRESRLSLGISGTISRYHLNTSKFNPVNPDDNVLYADNNAIIPDFNAGILYYNRSFFGGISVNRLVNFSRKLNHRQDDPDIIICGGYKFKTGSSFKLEPSVFIQKIQDQDVIFDINGKLYYNDRNWLILSYRNNGELTGVIGLTVKPGFLINYGYTLGLSGFSNYNSGSHSISLKVNVETLIRNRK
ncbi:MAG: PorP/SprF family type IX secretion system membrane protein [Bacteroidales bacterium]|nr:PorP/SprF family type IX secretion system membrane protein [Bacteroidales bacterium]